MNSIDPFPTAAPDFSDPLGLLRACHERILQHCDMLERLARHLADKGLDHEVREAAARVHRYFSTAAQHHHADEDEDLFPSLARQSLELANMVHQLKLEHEQIDALWQELEPFMATPDSIEDTAAFAKLAQHFIEAYRPHVEKENKDLLAMAQDIFGSDELKQIGRAMAERRGISLPDTF